MFFRKPSKPVTPTRATSDPVALGNPDYTARVFTRQFGAMAVFATVEHEVKARIRGDQEATEFWAAVCKAIIRIRLDNNSPAGKSTSSPDGTHQQAA